MSDTLFVGSRRNLAAFNYPEFGERWTDGTVTSCDDMRHSSTYALVEFNYSLRESYRRREMYISQASRACVSVCLFLAAFPHYCTDPDVTWPMVGAAP